MRDFFERNRRIVLSKNDENKLFHGKFSSSECNINDRENSFNYKLIQYVHNIDNISKKEHHLDKSIPYIGIECNLGHNTISCDILSQEEKDIIQHMMNAKPDIAIIYTENKTRNLLLLECKFKSSEKIYNKSGKKQRDIQWKIADFLCNHYLKEQIIISDKMKNNKSCLVKFIRKKRSKNQKNSSNEILINDLITINNEIFS